MTVRIVVVVDAVAAVVVVVVEVSVAEVVGAHDSNGGAHLVSFASL